MIRGPLPGDPPVLPLPELLDGRAMTDRLTRGGLSTEGAERASEHLGRAARRLQEWTGCLQEGNAPPPSAALFVPGRIEVLGKHTDYAGGRSLLAAMEWGFSVIVVPTPGERITVLAGSGPGADFPIRGTGPSEPAWARYPATVVRRLLRDFPERIGGGAALAFSSSLPPAAGMSSSSALVTAIFLALASRYRLPASAAFQEGAGRSRVTLATYLAAVESGDVEDPGVGTHGGSEDHTAILCARAGQLARFRFRPTVEEGAVPLPGGWTFAVAASGVTAEKAGEAREAYNRLSREAEAAAGEWRRLTGGGERHLGEVLASGPEASRHLLDRFEASPFAGRVRQFATESGELIPSSTEALARGDLGAFGKAAARSHALAVETLGNQVPETIFLARSARELGAAGASAFGAGFGGAVWALVETRSSGGFLKRWKEAYLSGFPERVDSCAFLETPPGPGAFRVA